MTIDWTRYDLSSLTTAYTLANIAAYLFNEFQRDPVFQAIAASYSPDEFATELSTQMERHELTVEQAVKAYVCLVALATKDPTSALALAKQGVLFPMRWGQEIAAIGNSRLVKTSLLHVEYRLSQTSTTPLTNTSSSTSAHNLDPQWRALIKP